MRARPLPLLGLTLAACTPDVAAVYDPSRATHFFDVPFPSDGQRTADGHPDLTGFPLAPGALVAGVEQGWVDRVELATRDFANHGAVYLRLDGPIELPSQTDGLPDDPVVLVAADGSELLPLEVRFVADPAGDPHWGPNTVALSPRLGHPPRSGARYVAAVMRSAGVAPAPDWTPDDGVLDALATAGVRGKPALATTFTVQDGTADLRALADAADAYLSDGAGVTLRRVVQLEYRASTTPSGEPTTEEIATYEDGSSRSVYLDFDEGEVQTVDLLDWPMIVYEADLPVPVFQSAEDRPYMNPGLGHIADVSRQTGWIPFDADGRVASTPWTDTTRLTISVPKAPDGSMKPGVGVMLWDHGTSGDAYNIVQRPNVADDSRGVAAAFADAGWVTVGRDATLYGGRYPLIDEGYGGSLGFYNIVNAPAFRDNQRQTALEGYVVRRFVQDVLPGLLPEGVIQPARLRRGGHSLGSVTSNLGLAMEPGVYEDALLVGTGGLFLHYFLDTGLLDTIDPAVIDGLLGLFGAATPDPLTTSALLAAAMEIPEGAWGAVDRLHPLAVLFQWQMDPSDPMSVARDEDAPAWVVIAPGDRQTPDFTAEALAKPTALPRATVSTCVARSDYDPHQCLWREPEGVETVRAWLAR